MVVLPTTFRWISSTKTDNTDIYEPIQKMVLSFSVPTTIVPAPQEGSAGEGGPTPMNLDSGPHYPPPASSKHCDIPGCENVRKYRLVKDWERGACGMAHLKTLEAQLGQVA